MPRQKQPFEQQDFLGGRVSNKHAIFKVLSRLGYEEAEQYAILEFLEWFLVNPEADLMMVLKKATEYVGMGRFMPLTQELTKLSMILGYARKTRDY